MADKPAAPGTPPIPVWAALKGCCPRCGETPLYSGLLKLADICPRCGTDFRKTDPGDGAQIFVIFFASLVLALLAGVLHGLFAPPAWVHLVVLSTLTLPMCLWMQRVIKAWLIAKELQHDAHEGQLGTAAGSDAAPGNGDS